MKVRGGHQYSAAYLVTIIILLAVCLPIVSTTFFRKATAEEREFEVERSEVNVTIPPDSLHTIDFSLLEGEENELIYTLQVKEGLPIDVWFLNEDNYLLLLGGGQFLFFMDGSEQQFVYTKKIVTLAQPGNYKLVLTNYNNQSVEVNIRLEERSYFADSDEESYWESANLLYPLLIAVVILALLVIILLLKARKYGRAGPQTAGKVRPEKPKVSTTKKAKPKVTKKDATGFCGNCGKPVTTPFCKHCGQKV